MHKPVFISEINISTCYKLTNVNYLKNNIKLNTPSSANYITQTRNTTQSNHTPNFIIHNWYNLTNSVLFTKSTTPKTQINKQTNTIIEISKFLSKDLKCADYTKYDINRLFSTTKAKKNKQIWGGLVSWENVININFLQKERLYTKLKYSRSPAYDIVSGGAAALFAGLLGFLTSEKFGFELVDSGDFYYLFMYVVFLSFSVRPLLLVSEFDKSFWNTFSFYKIYNFYFTVYLLVVQNIFTWCTINFSYTPTK